MKPQHFLGIAATLAVACAAPVSAQMQTQKPALPATQSFSPRQLRGYGNVSATFRETNEGSVLQITCESVAKAQLLQAKYLSDVALLAGVSAQKLSVKSAAIETRAVENQGSVAAARVGKTVFIFAAPDAARLTALLTREIPFGEKGNAKDSAAKDHAESTPVWRAEVKVPMWLDRWDKFGFRFYYRPWELPEGQTLASYDFTREFDYARDQDRAGFLFWNAPQTADTAEGLMNTGWWDWAQAEAKKRELPVAINSAANESPTWLTNRYRDQIQLKMPGFTGNYHRLMDSGLGGEGVVSWNSRPAQDALLGLIQNSIRRFAADENVVSFLEPHGELYHGRQDIFLEYGPVADAAYRRFLQEKYTAVQTVSRRWGMDLKSFDEVRVPEVASFAGWGPQALDVGGAWRVGYEELPDTANTRPYNYATQVRPSTPAPDAWFQPGFDDAAWPQMIAPGHDIQLYTPKRPAVFRRDFDVSADWKAKNPRVWLYLWDLSTATGDSVRAYVNGTEVGRGTVENYTPHWGAYEVSSALKAGKNLLALRLPQGYLAYRVYLSPTPPKQYPNLGENLNAQWVDFSNFTQWSRLQAARRGVEMIRQVDSNRQITLMAPDEYADGIKQIAQNYGGNFHNTGYMDAFWADYLPTVMRGAGLPFSLEPGGPAGNLTEFKNKLGLWQTEGIQGVDYFIHIGNVMWNPEIKAYFEAQRRQIALIGKHHFAPAQTGVLYSDRIAQLTGYPWGSDANTDLGSGYWNWNASSVLRGHYAYDGLMPSSFANGDAAKYRVIVDSNTSIMDEAMVAAIEKWVRAGGTFITLAQTGRHTPEKPDAWPIARLTGYRVSKIDRLKPDGDLIETGALQAAPDQKIFDATWNGTRANGLHLEKQATDARDLLMWDDGSVAAGFRPLGKGFVVQLGAKFAGKRIPDRLEPGGNSPETKHLRDMMTALLQWRGVPTEPGRLAEENDFVLMRPSVSNNGLFDVWTLWNKSGNQAQTVSLVFENGKNPPFAIDARDGKTRELSGAKLENIALEPLETKIFLTPRGDISRAPLAWFDLQRNWWQGTTAPDPKPFPTSSRFAFDLSENWKFQIVPKEESVTPMTAATFDDARWKPRSLGIWNTKEEGGGRGVFRKTFTVPAHWQNGRITLWITSWWNTSFVEAGRVWLDGREIKQMNDGGLPGLQLDSKPGTQHVLVVEAQSAGVFAGLRGQSWLSFEPAPQSSLDLAGQWQPSSDALKFDALIALPGPFETYTLRRNAMVDAKHRGQNAVFIIEADAPIVGVLINGTLVRRHHHMIGTRTVLNLTPFIRFGEENEFQIVLHGEAAKGQVKAISLQFYDPKTYP